MWQWIFGYMMEVRPDLFLNCGLEYSDIEKTGKSVIHSSRNKGNILAKLLDDNEYQSLNIVAQYSNNIKTYLTECFDDLWEVDRYFIEILKMNIV